MSSNQDSVCEEAVYEKVFMEQSKGLRNFIYYKCGDTSLAEDMVQEAFLKLWDHCAKVPLENAKAYLYTVARNSFFKLVEKKKVQLKHTEHKSPSINTENPEFILQEKEFQQQLNDAIGNLPDKQREVFLLNKIEKKKYREIAELLDISVKAVEKRMHLALVTLRKEIPFFRKK